MRAPRRPWFDLRFTASCATKYNPETPVISLPSVEGARTRPLARPLASAPATGTPDVVQPVVILQGGQRVDRRAALQRSLVADRPGGGQHGQGVPDGPQRPPGHPGQLGPG